MMREGTLETRRGIKGHFLEAGSGRPLVWLHGAGGLLPQEPLLERLANRYHVYAPEWPGYGVETTEDALEDMLDFALHGWDLVDALELGARPILVGHSMGGMIAAEMATLAPRDLDRLVLISAAGLWLDAYPIPDIFSMLPFQLAQTLFFDPKAGEALLTGGIDFGDVDALKAFLVRNARRLGTAGKIMFPIPNRRIRKRLYRLSARTLLVWGREDRLIPPVYGERWLELLPNARIEWIERAGHMVPHEAPEKVAAAIESFLE